MILGHDLHFYNLNDGVSISAIASVASIRTQCRHLYCNAVMSVTTRRLHQDANRNVPTRTVAICPAEP